MLKIAPNPHAVMMFLVFWVVCVGLGANMVIDALWKGVLALCGYAVATYGILLVVNSLRRADTLTVANRRLTHQVEFLILLTKADITVVAYTAETKRQAIDEFSSDISHCGALRTFPEYRAVVAENLWDLGYRKVKPVEERAGT